MRSRSDTNRAIVTRSGANRRCPTGRIRAQIARPLRKCALYWLAELISVTTHAIHFEAESEVLSGTFERLSPDDDLITFDPVGFRRIISATHENFTGHFDHGRW
jgi:hypothetical protein